MDVAGRLKRRSATISRATKGSFLWILLTLFCHSLEAGVHQVDLPNGWTIVAVPPAPSPVPPDPAAPDITAPSRVQRMALENGAYKSFPGWQKKVAALQY